MDKRPAKQDRYNAYSTGVNDRPSGTGSGEGPNDLLRMYAGNTKKMITESKHFMTLQTILKIY